MYKLSQEKKALHVKKVIQNCKISSALSWDDVITATKKKIVILQHAVQAFEEWRDSGEPFPGEKSEREEAGA